MLFRYLYALESTRVLPVFTRVLLASKRTRTIVTKPPTSTYVQVHRVTYEYIRVTYEYQRVTYEYQQVTYEWAKA